MPQVVPNKYHLRQVVCISRVVPSKYLRHVGRMPEMVLTNYHLDMLAVHL